MRLVVVGVIIAAASVGCALAEVSSPIDLQVILSQPPAVGATAWAEYTVEADEEITDVTVTVALSPGVRRAGGGPNWRGGLRASEKRRVRFAVRPISSGNKRITITAVGRLPDGSTCSDVAQVFFHSARASGRRGYVLEGEPSSTPCTQSSVGSPRVSATAVDGLLTVTGRWYYFDRANAHKPLKWMLVQLLRGDDGSVLASAETDASGYYAFAPVANPGAAGFKVKVWCYYLNPASCDGTALRVVGEGQGRTDGGNSVIGYNSTTGLATSPDGAWDMGAWDIADGSLNEGAFWLMQDLVEAWWWTYDLGDHTRPAGGVTVEWSPTSAHGNHNHRTDDGGNIHLRAEAATVCDALLHEYGHEVHWDGFGQWLPDMDCPNPHYISKISAPNCAWTEGFASWFKFAVTGDPVYHFPGGGGTNLETPTWGTPGWDNGDLCEGRVAGAMWDIGDAVVDGYDTSNVAWADLWTVWYGPENRTSTFAEFWAKWRTSGLSAHHPVKALYQCTIDYNTAPDLAALPDRALERATTWDDAFRLWDYAADPESSDDELAYLVTNMTDPACGAAIDPADRIDISPAPAWTGSSTVTVACTDGIRTVTGDFRVVCADFYDRIGRALDKPDGAWVGVRDKTVSAVFADGCYIQEPDRSAGVRVTGIAAPVEGASVTVAGKLSTTDGSRSLTEAAPGR